MTAFTLEDLAATITRRARSDDESSYTRKLALAGVSRCAQKLGEEAVEAAIAAATGDREGLRTEAADVLYHLLVLLEVAGVPFAEVKRELAGRTGRTGLEEKAARALR